MKRWFRTDLIRNYNIKQCNKRGSRKSLKNLKLQNIKIILNETV